MDIKSMTTKPGTIDIENALWIAEQAKGYWVPLCKEYPNLYGITCEDIDEFIDAYVRTHPDMEITEAGVRVHISPTELMKKREYLIQYLKHVKCLDRIEVYRACRAIGKRLRSKLKLSLDSPLNMYLTSPRGGYETLSIFAYANDLMKRNIPVDLRIVNDKLYGKTIYDLELDTSFDISVCNIIIVDDIIASGQQFCEAIGSFCAFLLENSEPLFNELKNRIYYVTVACRDEPSHICMLESSHNKDKLDEVILDTWYNRTFSFYKTIGILRFDELYHTQKLKKSDIITMRFPWGSPDGESDEIIRALYKGRHIEPEIHRRRGYSEDVSNSYGKTVPVETVPVEFETEAKESDKTVPVEFEKSEPPIYTEEVSDVIQNLVCELQLRDLIGKLYVDKFAKIVGSGLGTYRKGDIIPLTILTTKDKYKRIIKYLNARVVDRYINRIEIKFNKDDIEFIATLRDSISPAEKHNLIEITCKKSR